MKRPKINEKDARVGPFKILGAFLIVNIVFFVCLKRPKINEKEAGVGPFKKDIEGPLFVMQIMFQREK